MAVLIDSSIWVSFLNQPHSFEKKAVDQLIEKSQAVITGIVLLELLQGIRGQSDRTLLLEKLRILPYLEEKWDTWVLAGELGAHLAARGQKIPMSDLLLSAVAIENDILLYTADKHFHRLRSLKLYDPVI